MKKDKNIEREFAKEIKSLRDMKADTDISVPDISEIRSLVQDVAEKKERKARMAFLLFACVAAAMLIGMCLAILTYKSLFLLIQIGSLLPLPFVAILYGRRAKKNG